MWLATAMLLLMVGTTAAGITMSVTSTDPTVGPGGTAACEVNICYFLPDPPTEHTVPYIDNPRLGWTYTFNPDEFDIPRNGTPC